MSLLETLLRSLVDLVTPELVCDQCRRPHDEVVGRAGDFSLCSRCHASITSKTGVAVRRRRPEGPQP